MFCDICTLFDSWLIFESNNFAIQTAMYWGYFSYLGLVYYLMESATGDTVCSEIFGSPTYNDCEELATELSGGWPGEEPRPDRRLHLFTVPDAVIPSWVSPHPRNRKVILPQFASEGWSRRYFSRPVQGS